MPISFNQVPSGLRVPFVAAEIDNSQASQGPSLLEYRALLIGQMTASGTAVANSLYQVSSADAVATLAGRGSMLHRQALAWFSQNQSTEVWIAVLADNGAGVQAAGAIAFTGPATAAGTISFYIGGTLVQCAVASGDTANAIATNMAAAITANANLPVTAAVDGVTLSKVDITFRHKGAVGNELDLRVNYQNSEALPAGVTATITAMSGGTTNPVLTTLITNLGDSWYQVWAHPYTDSTSLAAIETELHSRFGPLRMIDGVAITCKSDTLVNLETLGDGRNSQHSSILASNSSPTATFEIAAAVAGAVAASGAEDPARPFQTLEVPWVMAPAEGDRFTLQNRDTLLHHGISTLRVGGGDVVQIERMITTYHTNAAGSADTSYLDVTTMLNLLYLRFDFRNRIQSRYPRAKLTDDGTRIGPGQSVITPKIGKAEAILWFRDMEKLGLVEDFDTFKTNLVVERNATDPNRLDFLLPPNLINQLIVTGVQIQFRL